MYLITLSYILFLLISVITYWLIPVPKYRTQFLIISSLFFACSYSILFTLLYIGIGGIVYLSAQSMELRGFYKKKELMLIIILVGIIGNLCLFKIRDYYPLETMPFSGFSALPFGFDKIMIPFGLSFLSFRLIHYSVDSYKGAIPRHSLVSFMHYILFFPVFLAGPLERFESFHSQTRKNVNFDLSSVNYGLLRILIGILKKIFIADTIRRLISPVLAAPGLFSYMQVILAVYGLAMQIYVDFSAYTDIAIGSARLFGYKITENFNSPFLKPNIAQYWRSWHITLYTFIRDYLFYPVFGYRASKAKIYLGLFISFLVFNLWHRISLNFFISGIYFGAGLIAWYIFQDIKRKIPALKRLIDRPYFNIFSTFLTFNFVSFGFIFFIADSGKVSAIVQKIF